MTDRSNRALSFPPKPADVEERRQQIADLKERDLDEILCDAVAKRVCRYADRSPIDRPEVKEYLLPIVKDHVNQKILAELFSEHETPHPQAVPKKRQRFFKNDDDVEVSVRRLICSTYGAGSRRLVRRKCLRIINLLTRELNATAFAVYVHRRYPPR